MARLILRNEDQERVIELTDPVSVIGRTSECSIQVDVQECSRRQAQVERCEAGFKLVDLESRNGTKVNGKVANQHLLKTGDIIKIGKVTLKFEADPPPPPAASPAGAASTHGGGGTSRPGTRHGHASTHHGAGSQHGVHADRRTRRARAPGLASRSAAGAAALVMAVLSGLVVVVLLRSGGSPEDEARQMCDEASRIEAKDPDGALRKLRGVTPLAGRWYDEAQARIRSIERRRDLARTSGLSEEQAFDILREYIARHPAAEYAEETLRQCAEFKTSYPRGSRGAEVDEFAAAARLRKDGARLADLRKTEEEITLQVKRCNFGAAIQAVNGLYARNRADLALRESITKRYREVVEAGRGWFQSQLDQVKKLQEANPDEARRICIEIVANLGDGRVEEFATACGLALMMHRLMGP